MTNDECPMPKARLPVRMVERLHAALAGDPVTEGYVLAFIEAHFGASSLFGLPAKVAEEALRRPADFLRAAKRFCEPELGF